MTEFSDCLTTACKEHVPEISQAQVARNMRKSASTVSDWFSGKRPPARGEYRALFEAVFPRQSDQNTNRAHEFRRLFEEERRRYENDKALPPYEQVRFSYRELWAQLMATRIGDVTILAQGGSTSSSLAGFAKSQFTLSTTGEKFYVAPPHGLTHLVDEGKLKYDIHARIDVFPKTFPDLLSVLPFPDTLDRIRRHAEEYAAEVIDGLMSPRGRPLPYNKPTLGVFAVEPNMQPGPDEEPSVAMRFYEADYFTYRVMSRIYQDIRREHPQLLDRMERFPALYVDRLLIPMPFLVPACGLDCMIICRSHHGDEICFTEIADGSAHPFQRHRLHHPIDEGLNTKDYDASGNPSVTKAYRRALKEEMGIAENDPGITGFEVMAVFADRTSGEIGIFAVITTTYSVSDLNRRRELGSPDKPREFSRELIPVPLDPSEIVKFVMRQNRSINSFTSYAPSLIDILLSRLERGSK